MYQITYFYTLNLHNVIMCQLYLNKAGKVFFFFLRLTVTEASDLGWSPDR